MAFFVNPIIDQYSNNEEKSELRLRVYLRQETGFICRKEVPDKGCDLDVELILGENQSSNWKFPIQLKSIEALNLVSNGQFISLPFETSRLGYLMRRIPAMGLVVFYSVKENRCFYEFVDKIYSALMEERGSDDWKKNDKVNIRVPYTNVVDEASTEEIHKVIKKRYEQASIMQNSHGEKYGLPTVGLVDDFQFDFHNVNHVKRFLREYGLLLLNNYDLGVIHSLVTQLPNLEIYQNKELLLIAAISYAEASLHTESQLFTKKLSKCELTSNEQLMLRFVELKNEYALGYLSGDQMLKALEELNTESTDDQNKIIISINQIQYRLAEHKTFISLPEEILSSIIDIFLAIDRSNCNERTKGLLTLWNCENLSYLISTISSAKIGEVRIRESLGENMPVEEKMKGAQEIMKLETLLHDKVSVINKNASLQNDKLMKAYSMALDVKHYIHHQINYFAFQVPINLHSEFDKRIAHKISYAASAYNYFIRLKMDKEAYESLCNLLELIELAEGYGINHDYDKGKLYKVKQQMEGALEIVPRPIMFVRLIKDKNEQKISRENGGMEALKRLTDGQIESLAKIVLLGLRLPQICLQNLIDEMKAYRLFYQRCTDENILLLQKKNEYETQHPYYLPIRFVLRSRSTGIETSESSNMDSLLSTWGY